MNVWKKQTVRYRKDGKNVAKGTEGADRVVILSKRFYGTLKTSQGERKQVPLFEDAKSSEKLLHTLQSDEERKQILGISDDDEKVVKLTEELLAHYLEYLTLKGNIAQYIKAVGQHLRKLFKQAKIQTLADLNSSVVLKTMSKWTVSLETKNHYIRDVKGFSKWLLRERHLKDDPFIGLKCFNAKTDRRRIRRAFTDDELSQLLNSTNTCDKRYLGKDWQFLPADRVMLYRIAANTGLRAKEIASAEL